MRKGTKILIGGRLTTGKYTNKDGQTVYTTDVIIEECEFAESKNASDRNRQADNSSPASAASGDGFMNIPDGIDDELPFN